MRYYFFTVCVLLFAACGLKKSEADLMFFNGRVYTVDKNFTVKQAFVIRDGKIVASGSDEEMFQKFSAKEAVDLQEKAVFPGFIDAHCHFLGYGLGLTRVDLVGTRSFAEVIERVVASSQKNKSLDMAVNTEGLQQTSMDSWILGRGWDQNDWQNKEMPDRRILDSLFPGRPVMLTRIDGHAVLANGEALRRAGIDDDTKISGGELIRKNGWLSGVLVDNAIDLIKSVVPRTSEEEKAEALLNAQEQCLAMGLTSIDDAGLMYNDIDLIESLQNKKLLKMRIYAMLSDSQPNYDRFLKKGPYKTDHLNVRSFKFYVDGALGSRGACLFHDYNDKPGWKGFLLSPVKHFEQKADTLSKYGFQMNAHCIGDSAASAVMWIYNRYCRNGANKRWRVEHAQVIRDFNLFNEDIIPSVQPTHATSDMYWAEERLGSHRVKNAYAYKKLLKVAGIVALGTDFPVEDISPFKTFYAATERKNEKGLPENGFQANNALSREEALRGMTIWAAFANFEEKEKGSLEKGKFADFVILDQDLMKCKPEEILGTKVLATYIGGEKVFGEPAGKK